MTPKRRIYLDLDEKVADLARDKAHNLRVSQKRYVEMLIEKDNEQKGKANGKQK